jgi:hypothetical protein
MQSEEIARQIKLCEDFLATSREALKKSDEDANRELAKLESSIGKLKERLAEVLAQESTDQTPRPLTVPELEEKAQELERTGRMPSLERLTQVMGEVRAKYQGKILEARKTGGKKDD